MQLKEISVAFSENYILGRIGLSTLKVFSICITFKKMSVNHSTLIWQRIFKSWFRNLLKIGHNLIYLARLSYIYEVFIGFSLIALGQFKKAYKTADQKVMVLLNPKNNQVESNFIKPWWIIRRWQEILHNGYHHPKCVLLLYSK